MIEAFQGLRDRRRGVGPRRAVEHDHGQAEAAGGGELAVGGVAAAVLRHEELDAPGLEERGFLGLAERPAGEEGFGLGRQLVGRDRLDAADEVAVLRGGAEGGDLLAADGEEDAARLGPEGGDGGGEIIATGTPEQVATEPASYTGRFLEELVEPAVTRARKRKREPVAA